MSALSRVVRSGVSRRWVQTVVIMLATAAAVTAGVLGIGLLVASNAPFDHAFAAQRGAHLTVLTDPAKATAAQLAASAEADGVAEASGPFAVAQVMVLPPPPPGLSEPPVGAHGPVLTVAARTGPGTGVDQVTLVEGRWPGKPGEALLAAGGDFRVDVGDTLTMGDGTNAQDVTVVGLARSVSDTADAWMTPGGLAAVPSMSSGETSNASSPVVAATPAVSGHTAEGGLAGQIARNISGRFQGRIARTRTGLCAGDIAQQLIALARISGSIRSRESRTELTRRQSRFDFCGRISRVGDCCRESERSYAQTHGRDIRNPSSPRIFSASHCTPSLSKL